MTQKKSHSGIKTYRYENLQIEELPYFLYEFTIYKIYKKGFLLLSSKYYKSDNLLNVKESKVIKRFNKFSIVAFVTLLGTPKEFIEQNNLKEFEYEKRKNRNTR